MVSGSMGVHACVQKERVQWKEERGGEGRGEQSKRKDQALRNFGDWGLG